MKILTTKKELLADVSALKALGKTIGFVPTMGALHEGHFSLVRRCANENDVCVVSIFVNPTQFNNPEDLEKYPRDLKRDTEALAEMGCNLVFAPSPEEMYSPEEMTQTFKFDFGGLDQVMEGLYRPGHFNGVVQVVSKLFDLVQPYRAYFGEKDFQQIAVIKRRILFESRQLTASQSVCQVQSWVIEQINRVDGLRVEYYEIVDCDTLQPATEWKNAIGCVTVYCGDVRLIDNIKYIG